MTDADDLQQNPTLESLSPAQQRALVAILEGKTITAAAEAASVGRTTVHRWLKYDLIFKAALSAARKELWLATCRRLDCLTVKAVECVEKAIETGDVRAALEVLKGLQVFDRVSIESKDPVDLPWEAEMLARTADSVGRS